MSQKSVAPKSSSAGGRPNQASSGSLTIPAGWPSPRASPKGYIEHARLPILNQHSGVEGRDRSSNESRALGLSAAPHTNYSCFSNQ
jgi:hypothetical protein